MISLLLATILLQKPVLTGADPHAAVVGDVVWMYPTDGTHQVGSAFWAYSSRDLKTWTEHGPILHFDGIPWIKEDGKAWHGAWAPALAQKGRKFYLYYSVGPQDPVSRLGVAVSDSPAGPFKDSGKALFSGGNGFEAIDPMVFHDPKTGKDLLYAGGSAGSKLRCWELNADMVSFKREIPVPNPKLFTEGVFMHVRNGIYYLTYSHGGWRDASYSVHYATSSSATGPWTYRGPILTTAESHKGPGHWSVIKKPGRDEWYVVFHAWPAQPGNGPYNGERQISIRRLVHTKSGLIEPIRLDQTAPAWR